MIAESREKVDLFHVTRRIIVIHEREHCGRHEVLAVGTEYGLGKRQVQAGCFDRKFEKFPIVGDAMDRQALMQPPLDEARVPNMDVALQFEGHGKIALLGKLENALFGVRCAPDFHQSRHVRVAQDVYVTCPIVVLWNWLSFIRAFGLLLMHPFAVFEPAADSN